jgi:Mg-chelatase subunit ChlI
MTNNQLKDLCNVLGLQKKGLHAALVDRIAGRDSLEGLMATHVKKLKERCKELGIKVTRNMANKEGLANAVHAYLNGKTPKAGKAKAKAKTPAKNKKPAKKPAEENEEEAEEGEEEAEEEEGEEAEEEGEEEEGAEDEEGAEEEAEEEGEEEEAEEEGEEEAEDEAEDEEGDDDEEEVQPAPKKKKWCINGTNVSRAALGRA